LGIAEISLGRNEFISARICDSKAKVNAKVGHPPKKTNGKMESEEEGREGWVRWVGENSGEGVEVGR